MNLVQTVMQNKNLMNLCLKAFGAMMRGESPTEFLKNVAKTNPALQGYDFDDLEVTANKVCEEKGEDINALQTQITEFANSHINH